MSKLPSAMILFSACLLAATAGQVAAQEVPWRTDYNAARKEAREKNKPLVLDFSTDNCHYCKQLDAITFRDPAIIKALNEQFIPVKVDASRDPNLAKALDITSFPTLVYAAPNGKILGQQDGYLDAAGFGRQLERLQADVARLASVSETNVQTGDRGKRARDLSAQAKDDPERLAQACEELIEALGNTYLELAESLLRKGQAPQAISYLEKTVRTCPGTHAAQLAQERLSQVKDGKGAVRGQMP